PPRGAFTVAAADRRVLPASPLETFDIDQEVLALAVCGAKPEVGLHPGGAGEDRHVEPIAAIHRIVVGAADETVRARLAIEQVVAAAAPEDIVPAVNGAAGDRVPVAMDRVVARPAVDDVVAAVNACRCGGFPVAEDEVVAGPPRDAVASADDNSADALGDGLELIARNDVVSIATVDRVSSSIAVKGTDPRLVAISVGDILVTRDR